MPIHVLSSPCSTINHRNGYFVCPRFPLPREELVRQAKSEPPSMTALFDASNRVWPFSALLSISLPYILAEGETLPLLREGQSSTTPFRARRLTPLCIPTKVSQTRTSLMHPAASLI